MSRKCIGDCLEYASDEFEGFEIDRGIPRGLVMRDQMRSGRPFSLAGLGGFNGLEPPFPEWYTGSIVKSTAPLAPSGTVVRRDSISTVGQAMNYAAAGWRVSQKEGAVTALQRYRFAWDLGNFATKTGIQASTVGQLVTHLKKKLASADQAFNEFKGKAPVQKVEPVVAPSPRPVTEPTPAPIPAPFDMKKILTIAGVGLLGLVMFVAISQR